VSVADLPLVNATLNAIAGTLLLFGYVNIRRGRIKIHRRFMLSAFTASILFLISYVVYHANAGSRPFPGQGPIRAVYFFILVTHVVLAATVPFLAIITLTYGLRSRFDRHVRIARWTFPIWMYVSVTGVVVYLMLYRMY
jgi:putative membrane protein